LQNPELDIIRIFIANKRIENLKKPEEVTGLFNSMLKTNFQKSRNVNKMDLFWTCLTINKIKSYDINIP